MACHYVSPLKSFTRLSYTSLLLSFTLSHVLTTHLASNASSKSSRNMLSFFFNDIFHWGEDSKMYLFRCSISQNMQNISLLLVIIISTNNIPGGNRHKLSKNPDARSIKHFTKPLHGEV